MEQVSSTFRKVWCSYSKSKINASIFVDLCVIQDPVFEQQLSTKEKPAWNALVDVVECFLGSYRPEN